MMIVVQFGLAMTPWCHFTSSGFTSGTTSGTSSSRRKAEELSTITAPASTTALRNCFEIPAPALKSAMSTPRNDASVISSTAISSPRKRILFPAERAEARSLSEATGKFRRSRVLSISTPTAPVAPAMATW